MGYSQDGSFPWPATKVEKTASYNPYPIRRETSGFTVSEDSLPGYGNYFLRILLFMQKASGQKENLRAESDPPYKHCPKNPLFRKSHLL